MTINMVSELFIKHGIDLLFVIITAAVTFGYRTLYLKIKEEQSKNESIAKGVQCLLRQTIIEAHREYCTQGYCTIADKDAISLTYDAYKGLGGNDVAADLYHRILDLPTEPAVDYDPIHV